jgi:hypothetical protein
MILSSLAKIFNQGKLPPLLIPSDLTIHKFCIFNPISNTRPAIHFRISDNCQSKFQSKQALDENNTEEMQCKS